MVRSSPFLGTHPAAGSKGLLTLRQAACLAGVSTGTVRLWIHSGRLRSTAGRSGALIDPADLAGQVERSRRAQEGGYRRWPQPTIDTSAGRKPRPQVFLDPNGRRARVLRPAAATLVLLCAGYLAVLAMSFHGSPAAATRNRPAGITVGVRSCPAAESTAHGRACNRAKLCGTAGTRGTTSFPDGSNRACPARSAAVAVAVRTETAP
jgi:excisionase family DNA binding protein